MVCELRDPGFIENSCFIGTVTAAGGTIGGVVGNCYTNIKSCYFLGTIQFTSSDAAVGLLTGYLHNPTTDYYFTNCFCAKNTLIPAIGNVTVPEHVSICEESAFADGTVAAALNGNEGSDAVWWAQDRITMLKTFGGKSAELPVKQRFLPAKRLLRIVRLLVKQQSLPLLSQVQLPVQQQSLPQL